jgi:hypothetical protein
MRRALSVALALAVCTAWSAAHAAGKAYTIKELKELKELLAPAVKEIAPVRKTISVKVQEAADSGAKFVTNLGTIGAGIATGSAALCYSHNWCYQTATNVGSYFGFRDHPNDSNRTDDHE